ncbi:MAG: class I SAM-dependent methyltransferase, partial [Dokdonella sp.]
APRARSIVCVDASPRVVTAARERLKCFANVEVVTGDMHALDLGRRRFDLVLLMHALTYSEKPATVVAEAARVLAKGGRLLAATLGKHAHHGAVEPFDHRNLGFRPADLRGFAENAGLEVLKCERITRESKAPHFEVLTLLARKP